MYRSVITNLIGSICSPHLRRVSVNLECMVGEVEHFPWSTVNGLMKVSPHMLQRVEIALELQVETDSDWCISLPLSPAKYEGYFHQVRSALPELDEKVITSIAVRHSFYLFATLTLLAQRRIVLMNGSVTQLESNKDAINAVPVAL